MNDKPRIGICVDASCLGNPGPMQYRIANIADGSVIFESKPSPGTNNIGEFLAVVHALALCKKKDSPVKIWTDSVTAMAWVKKKKCKTTLQEIDLELADVIARAEDWLLKNEDFTVNRIFKWDTKSWGEIPADFGRK